MYQMLIDSPLLDALYPYILDIEHDRFTYRS